MWGRLTDWVQLRGRTPRNESPRTLRVRGRPTRDSRADRSAAQHDPARGLVSCNPELAGLPSKVRNAGLLVGSSEEFRIASQGQQREESSSEKELQPGVFGDDRHKAREPSTFRAPNILGPVNLENMAAAGRGREVETIAQGVEPRKVWSVVHQSISELLLPTKQRIKLSPNARAVDSEVDAVQRIRLRLQPRLACFEILETNSRHARVRDQCGDVDTSPVKSSGGLDTLGSLVRLDVMTGLASDFRVG